MQCRDNIQKIIEKLSNSKFDQQIIDEISISAMEIECFDNNIINNKQKDDYHILVRDMITSLCNMTYPFENLVFTNPFILIKLSWIAKYINDYDVNDKKALCFREDVIKLAKSNIILPNEFPIEMKLTLIDNLNLNIAKNERENWTKFVKRDSERFIKLINWADAGNLHNFIMYNNNFLANINKQKINQIGTYLILCGKLSTAIILTLLFPTTFLISSLKQECVSLESISDMIGMDLIKNINI
ncbi:hypothetical protein [Lactobacillus sp. ESL0230]|uniref:hypothetical protein n=1 Tax=Lactobacillus sp. ESL0230 TaxID=2069353 RepID=UPI000EFD61C4|nr:hypothetical protein [Lactobacillus sp. ESL0230]RMC46719.1 hypothetical protein F5ESL0230_05565 [Lactobacillus sp. ESL0230]